MNDNILTRLWGFLVWKIAAIVDIIRAMKEKL